MNGSASLAGGVTNPPGDKLHRAIKPDAQAFDEIRITTVPRYKTSGLSGDEWRISSKVQFLRKGIVRHEEFYRDVDTAAKYLTHELSKAQDEGKAYFAGEEDFCDQEGCSDKATVTYKIKQKYCCGPGGCGQKKEMYQQDIRMFCQRHSKRGDCGLEDADENYELVSGTPGSPNPGDVKEAAFGGVIDLSQE